MVEPTIRFFVISAARHTLYGFSREALLIAVAETCIFTGMCPVECRPTDWLLSRYCTHPLLRCMLLLSPPPPPSTPLLLNRIQSFSYLIESFESCEMSETSCEINWEGLTLGDESPARRREKEKSCWLAGTQ